MSLNDINREIENRAKQEMHTGQADAVKRFYAKSLSSDETPTPVMHGLIPKTDTAVEKEFTPELHNPGEFCYRKMALATGSGNIVKTIYVKRVMMNCPFCNKPQFLYNNERLYDGPPDPRGAFKKILNFIWSKAKGRELYPWKEQMTGTLTVKGPITCIFNNLHRFTVIKNRISFYYAKYPKAK